MRITRLFIDNYKCFVGFDFKPQAVQPIFGLNGTGKSTLFEVLAALKRLVVDGEPVDSCFPESAFTRWTRFPPKPFALSLDVGDDDTPDLYRYDLTLAVEHKSNKSWIRSETLRSPFHDTPLYAYQDWSATLYHDLDKSTQALLADEHRSGLSLVNPRPGTELLQRFVKWLGGVQWVALHPGLMRESSSDGEEPTLAWGGHNFVSWLRSVAQNQLPAMGKLNADLQECLDGFDGIRFEPIGKRKLLWSMFRRKSADSEQMDGYRFDFSELSDGQRMLIALYAVYHGLKGTNAVVCMDEPANYLALSEIQPYLLRLRDAVGDGLAQLFVVTHNPEAINDLAPDHPVLFSRGDDGSVQILPFPETNPDGLTAAELIARGWEQP